MEDFLVDLDDRGFLLLGGFGSRHGMALLSEVRLGIKTLTDWRAICIFKKCERFFTLPTFKEFMTPEVIKTLIEIANEQQRVMAA